MNRGITPHLLIACVFACTPSVGAAEHQIDITGNWQEESGFVSHLITREPELQEHQTKRFTQELVLEPGDYALKFQYDQKQERIRGRAIDRDYDSFNGLQIDGKPVSVAFRSIEDGGTVWVADVPFTVGEQSEATHLELSVGNTRVFQTWLVSQQSFVSSSRFRALAPSADREDLLVRGIPFSVPRLDIRHYGAGFRTRHPLADLDRGMVRPWAEGTGVQLDCGDAPVDKIHFLGMIHKVDISNGSWSSPRGDHSHSHFIGDTAGTIVINWSEGGHTEVPLIFGFNLWYGRPWDMLWFYVPYTLGEGPSGSWRAGYNFDSALFSGEDKYRDRIEEGVQLVDGMRLMGASSNNARFIFSMGLEGRAVQSIEVQGVDDMLSHPLISGVTIEAGRATTTLQSVPHISVADLESKITTLRDIEAESWKPGVEKIMRSLYSFKDSLPRLQEPDIPDGYFGPRYDFKGNQEAVYAATYLYKNGPENAAKIGDSGTGAASSTARKATFHYTLGLGIWRSVNPVWGSYSEWLELYQEKGPGELGDGTLEWGERSDIAMAWSRGIGELMREAMALGYDKFINRYTDWLDDRLFKDATPPHWVRVVGARAGFREQVGYTERQVGETLETGNRENDGHGICMWGRYLVWHWQGRPREWNEKHWRATKASVEWIQWQLDTDTIFPGVRKDVLYTESECSHNDYEFYSSYNSLHGIGLAIRMAEQLGKTREVERWTELYARLEQGILDHLIDASEFGPVWHTEPETNWQDDGQKMVHIQLATDGVTYTPLEDYARGTPTQQRFLEIDKHSWRKLIDAEIYNCLRMYGYGQGMMTQAALLMDEMGHAEQFVNMLVNHAYQPQLEGWTAPEGVILHKSGEYWQPVNGYMGQDSHLADSTKALRIMLGVDDNDPEHLRLVPRFPSSWNHTSIAGFPALVGKQRHDIQYTYKRSPALQTFDYDLSTPVGRLSIRLGPIPEGRTVVEATLDDEEIPFRSLESGDSQWIWIENITKSQGGIQLHLK